jgi:plasmid stability protein
MANLTITVDDQLLKRARIRAIENGTSVNAVVSEFLGRYAGDGGTHAALAAFLELARRSEASSGREGRSWRRDDLYDRPKYLQKK